MPSHYDHKLIMLGISCVSRMQPLEMLGTNWPSLPASCSWILSISMGVVTTTWQVPAPQPASTSPHRGKYLWTKSKDKRKKRKNHVQVHSVEKRKPIWKHDMSLCRCIKCGNKGKWKKTNIYRTKYIFHLNFNFIYSVEFFEFYYFICRYKGHIVIIVSIYGCSKKPQH